MLRLGSLDFGLFGVESEADAAIDGCRGGGMDFLRFFRYSGFVIKLIKRGGRWAASTFYECGNQVSPQIQRVPLFGKQLRPALLC